MSSTALDENTKTPSSSSTRFDTPGLNFKAKLIGLEDVAKSRGHKMCQVAMAKVKAAVLAIGEHKTKITVNVSIEGIKIMDEKAEVVLHHHPVHKVSFISRDTNDPRAFGYVFNGDNGSHQFVGIKTEKAAEPLIMTLKDLFQTMVELKQEREREAAKNKANAKASENEIKEENKKNQTDETQDDEKTHPSSMDLLGFDTGPEQLNDIQQLDPLVSGTSGTFSAWPNNNHPQNSTMPGAVVGLPGSSPQVPGIAMASTVYHQHQAYHPSIPRMQNSAFGFHHPNAFPAQAWPQAPVQAPIGLRAEAQPSKPTWMPLNPAATPTSGGSTSGLLQPTSAKPTTVASDDPLPPSTPTTKTKYPDPFADLAVIPPQGQPRPGRKASKDDFIKETPKQSLLDISRQQQQQQQPGSTRLLDPTSSGAVSPPKTRQLNPNPLADFQKTPPPSDIIIHPASPTHALDRPNRSPVASFQGPGSKVDRDRDPDPMTRGSLTSRPRPKGSPAATRPGPPGSLVLPPVKVTSKLLCTCTLEELHAKRYSRNTVVDTKLFRKSTPGCTKCTPTNRTRRSLATVRGVKLPQRSAPGDGNGKGKGKSNGKSLQRGEGGEFSTDGDEGKSFEELWSEMSKYNYNNDGLFGQLSRDNAWQSPKFSDADEIFEADITTHQNEAKMFGKTDRLLSSHESQDASDLVFRNSNFSETSGEDDSGSGSGCPSSDRIREEESVFRCDDDVFFGESFYFYSAEGDENFISADNTDCDGITGPEGGVTLSDSSSSSYLKPAPDSRPGSNRKGSARRTRSLSGLITIREETDSNSDGQAIRQRSRVDETRDTVAWTPGDAAQRCHGNFPFAPVDDPWGYPGGNSNPFLDVDPFLDELVSSFLVDPFEGQVKGQVVHSEVVDLFDVYTETPPETFKTRAVTFDF